MLNYVIHNPRSVINLNLFEAEKYESAVVVQQLVGNLVFYSNNGRYEPRIAERWERTADDTWTFYLNNNFKCENGEEINPASFKKSLERAIFIFSKQGEIPVFGLLEGMNAFIEENKANDLDSLVPLSGITTTASTITFKFSQSLKSGILQMLSFSPFGYISRENYQSDGKWLNENIFVSSGPYKVKQIELGKRYELVRNQNWPVFSKGSPASVLVSHKESEAIGNPVIIDAFTQNYENSQYKKFNLVPEYINSVLLGNLQTGYFSSLQNRKQFKAAFSNFRDQILPEKFGSNVRSSSFYPNQKLRVVEFKDVEHHASQKVDDPLIIEGTIPPADTPRWHAWLVLKSTLESLKLKYQFSGTGSAVADMTNKNYDIRIRGSSIGGGVEAWGLFVIFCSPFGINFPDPTGSVCGMLRDYESDKINEIELTQKFLIAVEEDAAILTTSHYGIQLYFSNHIDLNSVSPMMSILRFDQVVIKNAE